MERGHRRRIKRNQALKMRPYGAWILLAVLLGMLCNPATAEIYRWTDENGKVHFSDRPFGIPSAEKIELKINTYQGVSYEPLSASTTGKDAKRKQVVMYSASWCGVCVDAKRYFKSEGIPFQDYDVEKSSKGKRDFEKMQARGVPVILVGNQRMNGFTVGSFERLYGN